jgi:hypothetical protein
MRNILKKWDYLKKTNAFLIFIISHLNSLRDLEDFFLNYCPRKKILSLGDKLSSANSMKNFIYNC